MSLAEDSPDNAEEELHRDKANEEERGNDSGYGAAQDDEVKTGNEVNANDVGLAITGEVTANNPSAEKETGGAAATDNVEIAEGGEGSGEEIPSQHDEVAGGDEAGSHDGEESDNAKGVRHNEGEYDDADAGARAHSASGEEDAAHKSDAAAAAPVAFHPFPVPTPPGQPLSPAAPVPEVWPPYCDPAYRMPDLLHIEVVVDGEIRAFAVEVVRDRCGGGGESSGGVRCVPKAYLGGYRHRSNGKLYHHATTQFGQIVKKAAKDMSVLRSRDTQTCVTQHRSAQNYRREYGTQMERPGLALAASTDGPDGGEKHLFARPYKDAAAFWVRRLAALLLVQRCWRRHAARRIVEAVRRQLRQKREAEEAAATAAEAAAVVEAERAAKRRLGPRSARDFEVLYSELEEWKASEARRIVADDTLATPEARRAAAVALAARETKLLQTIHRMKARAAAAAAAGRAGRMLALMAAPKRWEMADGEVAEVHTPWTERAGELRELYAALEARLLPMEERLDVLLHVKWTAQEFDCRLTRDLCELIDREADLLRRGRCERSLEGLRRRIRTIFLRFVETPDFNPEASRFLKVPPRYQHLTEASTRDLTSLSSGGIGGGGSGSGGGRWQERAGGEGDGGSDVGAGAGMAAARGLAAVAAARMAPPVAPVS